MKKQSLTLEEIKKEIDSMIDWWKSEFDTYIQDEITRTLKEERETIYLQGYQDGYDEAVLDNDFKIMHANILKEGCCLYFISDNNFCKIGISVNPGERLKNLQTANGNELKIIHKILFSNRLEARLCEKKLHNLLSGSKCKTSNKKSEWFLLEKVQELLEKGDKYILEL